MKAKLLAIVLVLAGCSNANEPTDGGPVDDRGGVPAVIGAWCGPAHVATVTCSADGSAVARVFLNTTRQQIVADRDGVLRTQVVRGCKTGICDFFGDDVSSFTDGQLIARCKDALR